MANFVRKTFENSYLYKKDPELYNTSQKELLGFITTAERIEDKYSEAFSNITDAVKRNQTTSVLYSILMMNDVVICISKNKELPRAFKVFEAKDLRSESKRPKVFIDATGLIKYSNGYYTCKEIDKFITYLFDALGYLLYSKATIKLLNNSNVTISGAECFVAMFTYVLDYLRVIGYAQNKEKISYLSALYFIYHLMDKELDGYSKNIAAKIAGFSTSDTRAFDLYYDAEKDFVNIDSFISLISNTFKLRGLTTETFVYQWTRSYQAGTQYGTELFTSFMTILIGAYCGSYVINQKQIERCCGASMVKFVKEIGKIGTSEFDKRAYIPENAYEDMIARDKATMELKESFLNRSKLPSSSKVSQDTVANKEATKNAVESSIKYLRDTNQEDKISGYVTKSIGKCYNAMLEFGSKNKGYENGSLETIVKLGYKSINDSDKNYIIKDLKEWDEIFSDKAKKSNDKEISSRFNSCVVEIRKAINMI